MQVCGLCVRVCALAVGEPVQDMWGHFGCPRILGISRRVCAGVWPDRTELTVHTANGQILALLKWTSQAESAYTEVTLITFFAEKIVIFTLKMLDRKSIMPENFNYNLQAKNG